MTRSRLRRRVAFALLLCFTYQSFMSFTWHQERETVQVISPVDAQATLPDTSDPIQSNRGSTANFVENDIVKEIKKGTGDVETSPLMRFPVRAEELTISDRIFPKWNHSASEIPCFPVNQRNRKRPWYFPRNLREPTREGLFFVKLLKTGSTSGSSIHLRMASNLAKRRGVSPICRTRHLHGKAGQPYQYGQRNRVQSFLWTMVRQPQKRYVSEFFHFEVSRGNITPTDENFIHFLRHGKHADRHYLSWLSTSGYMQKKRNDEKVINSIFQDYDFIAVLERMDESIVALQMILDLPLSDLLHLPIKLSGSYDMFQNKCVHMQPSVVSPGVQGFFESDEWLGYVGPEQALYDAAVRSLNRTIDALDREVFVQKLAAYRHAQKVVGERCSQVKLPCSATGEYADESETHCLTVDYGCGFDCLDKVAAELQLD